MRTCTEIKYIPANESVLEYSDYANIAFIDYQGDKAKVKARMSRPLNSPQNGYNWDNPGARLRFCTNSDIVKVHLCFSDKHISESVRKPDGIYLIDGKSSPVWKYTSESKVIKRSVENYDLQLKVPKDGKLHDYDIIMPYGDSVDIIGISVSSGATFSQPTPRPEFRCAIYGDSITQGFTAGTIAETYAFKLAQKKNWQLINLGFGGRSSNPHDGTIVGKIKCDLLVVLMGINDWQGGIPVSQYKSNMTDFVKNFLCLQPSCPVLFITPLWVTPSWLPKKAKYKLEEYRKALREVIKNANDPKIKIIEGHKLIDHDPKYFDRIAVHPNNAGFKMMAERLDATLKI